MSKDVNLLPFMLALNRCCPMELLTDEKVVFEAIIKFRQSKKKRTFFLIISTFCDFSVIQAVFTYSKLTTETLEQGLKYVQS